MDPEQVDVDVEVTEEVTPEDQVKDFALSVSDKAKAVESGDMTVADFVSECMDALGQMEVAGESEPSPMGGLGQGGDFPDLAGLESEA